jgi:hypothetical protein
MCNIEQTQFGMGHSFLTRARTLKTNERILQAVHHVRRPRTKGEKAVVDPSPKKPDAAPFATKNGGSILQKISRG